MQDTTVAIFATVVSFDYIENQIERQKAFNMEQFAASVNKLLPFNAYQIHQDKGQISAAQVREKAESEYDIFIKPIGA